MDDPDDRTLIDELFGDVSGDISGGGASGPRRPAESWPDEKPAEPGRRNRNRQRSELAESGLPAHAPADAAPDAAAPDDDAAAPDAAAPDAASADAASADAVSADAVSADTVPGRPDWHGAAWLPPGIRQSAAPGFREIGLTTVGFVIFVSVDSIMMYAPFRTHGSTNLLPQALTLLLLAFGLGALMIWNIRGGYRPVGVGMMLGWVFMTLISAGYLTGLNP